MRIERDLLTIFKNQSYDNIIRSIMDIIDDNYVYEIDYLNNLENKTILIALNNLMSKVLKTKDVLIDKNWIYLITKFAEKVPLIDCKKIKDNKKPLVIVPTSILTAVVLISVLSNNNKTSAQETALIFSENTTYNAQNAIMVDGELSEFQLSSKSVTDEMIKESYDSLEIAEEAHSQQIVDYILENYNLTYDQFMTICAIVTAEAKANSYEDAYCVINTIYNRTQSETWNRYVSYWFGRSVGNSLYYQAIADGQFVVYENGMYKYYYGQTDSIAFQAVVDFLSNPSNTMHDYLSFLSAGSYLSQYEQFVKNGNKYYNTLLENDRISSETNSR